MSRMFLFNNKPMKTWNVFSGCRWQCSYCWARKMVETRLKDTPKYRECGFIPTFHEKELLKRFPSGSFVFVSSLGDISWSKFIQFSRILEKIQAMPDVDFLFCSKDPKWLRGFLTNICIPENIYLGTTLETDAYHQEISRAPVPYLRASALADIPHPRKFVSLEPLMDFNFESLRKMIWDIKPGIVEVGVDNYGHNLPEPSPGKVKELLVALREFVPIVVEKKGLERLKEEIKESDEDRRGKNG